MCAPTWSALCWPVSQINVCILMAAVCLASPLPGSSGPAGFSLDLSPCIRSLCASREPGNTFQSACRGCSSCWAGPDLALLVRLPYGDYIWNCEGCPTADGENRVFSHSLPGSLEGLGFHAWNHPVRKSLSQASCNGAISPLVSLGQGIS